MRYPVTAGGSKAEYDSAWYSAQDFGNPTKYGFHEGVDLNLKTLGDTDLGQELKAIAKGKVVYYHNSSHPTYGFGRHLVLKIDGPWGTRWVHYAHCDLQDFSGTVKEVNEGEIIGRVGKSGTPYAHLHFAIFKVDPVTIGGIDKVATDTVKLYDWWEDPLVFIDTWMNQPAPAPEPVITDSTKIPQIIDENGNQMEVQAIRSRLADQAKTITELRVKIETAKNALS